MLTAFPDIEELNKQLSVRRAEQYCLVLRRSINTFFYVGTRKKVPNKAVECLTNIIFLFMFTASHDTGLSATEIQKVKRARKTIEKLIAAVPSQDTMAKACSEQTRTEVASLATFFATYRAREAVDHLYLTIDENWLDTYNITFHNVILDVLDCNMERLHRTIATLAPLKDIFFFDVADSLASTKIS